MRRIREPPRSRREDIDRRGPPPPLRRPDLQLSGALPRKARTDIFLHTAGQLGLPPKDCLVIEDSVHGIQAAKAAGMPVVAFTGASHMLPVIVDRVLAAKPDFVASTMPELAALLTASSASPGA